MIEITYLDAVNRANDLWVLSGVLSSPNKACLIGVADYYPVKKADLSKVMIWTTRVLGDVFFPDEDLTKVWLNKEK